MAQKNIYRSFTIGLAVIALCACASTLSQLVSGEPHAFDFHAVEPIFGLAKYNMSSASDINRDSTKPPDPQDKIKPLIYGEAGDWKWRISATSTVAPTVESLRRARIVQVGHGTTAHTLNVPSLNAAMARFRMFYVRMLGSRLLPLDLDLVVYPESARVDIEKRLHSNRAIPLYFGFSIPINVTTDSSTAFSWILKTVGLIGHEYWHAYNRESLRAPFYNKFTEEVTAYTLETCIETALANGQGTFHLIDVGGKPINISESYLDAAGNKIASAVSADAEPSEPSNPEKIYSLYNMAWVLRTNVIKKGDAATHDRLYGLCYAMVNRPVDMTKGFYPRDQVQPMAFNH